jgi:primosomal protein N' (replication factor Y)
MEFQSIDAEGAREAPEGLDAPCRYAEVVVNIPMRRPFDAGPAAGASQPGPESGAPVEPEEPAFQSFTYAIPSDLQGLLRAGHLVWVPFHGRTVQGVVVSLARESQVRAKAIARLAFAEPVLSQTQLDLAAWMAWDLVASTAESVRLFLPPGLLQRSPDKLAVRSRRELLIELRLPPEEAEARLEGQARENDAVRLLRWFVLQPDARKAAADLCGECGVDTAALRLPLRRGWLAEEAGEIRLGVDADALEATIDRARGLGSRRAVIAALADAGGVLWRPDLYQRVDTDLATLRRLEEDGLIALNEYVYFRDPLRGRSYARTQPLPFSADQAAAWEALQRDGFARWQAGSGGGDSAPSAPATDEETAAPADSRFLLFGVTGSGKTEIYLRAIAETLARGRQAIVLVPEIALAPQTVRRVASRFPGRVTVIHSQLSSGERYDVWRALRAGEFDVVVGPRSALFAPMERLGLIVIDEEHESSYKQDSEAWGSFTVFYDARRVARRLAERTGSMLICGSATPSLEIYAEAMRGEVQLLRLERRVTSIPGYAPAEQSAAASLHMALSDEEEPASREEAAPAGAPESYRYGAMPPVEIVDMRQELRAGNRSIFSRSLQSELHATLDAGEQAILFLNRRGTHTVVMCRDCGYVASCPRCEVPLVYSEREGTLRCHHCGLREPLPQRCPTCNGTRIKYFGSGTEQIERRVREISPRARLLRWDADTTTSKGSHERILERFAAHEADVLVGTQMIAKGLDLPLVTLVGVVSADVGLHMPDFRAAERTFQLLTQVAGRAGRSSRGGRVVIQSYAPSHYAIQAAARHDYPRFFEHEMAFRREQEYPPVRRMARLVLWESSAERARREAERLADELRWLLDSLGLAESSRIIGPTPPFFARVRGHYRWQLMLLCQDPSAVLRQLQIPIGWRIDVDPVSVL